jgi:hypothetical protein
MAIGLEIEINVPIDQLSAVDIQDIQLIEAALPMLTDPQQVTQKLNAKRIQDQNGKVPYGVIQAAVNGYRVEADHDDRVSSKVFWPLHEGSKDSIIELVMDPPATDIAGIRTAMTGIGNLIGTIELNTVGLTTHWTNAFPGGINVGPLDTSLGKPAARQPHHGYQGSVQVNIGIDLREYHSLLKWYANSQYADPRRDTARQLYQDIKDDIHEAVDIGRSMTNQIMSGLSKTEKAGTGNCRGIRGFLTYMALYLIRGKIQGGLAGSTKNLVPTLMKSPNTIIAQYGMTAEEQTHYTNNRDALVRNLLTRCKRAVPPLTALDTVPVFATLPAGVDVDTFTDLTSNYVPLAGTPIPTPTGVGPLRTGNLAVRGITTVTAGVGVVGTTGANSRGGIIVEFRTLPGYYEGVAAWMTLAEDFFNAADERNQRNGIKPS